MRKRASRGGRACRGSPSRQLTRWRWCSTERVLANTTPAAACPPFRLRCAVTWYSTTAGLPSGSRRRSEASRSPHTSSPLTPKRYGNLKASCNWPQVMTADSPRSSINGSLRGSPQASPAAVAAPDAQLSQEQRPTAAEASPIAAEADRPVSGARSAVVPDKRDVLTPVAEQQGVPANGGALPAATLQVRHYCGNSPRWPGSLRCIVHGYSGRTVQQEHGGPKP